MSGILRLCLYTLQGNSEDDIDVAWNDNRSGPSDSPFSLVITSTMSTSKCHCFCEPASVVTRRRSDHDSGWEFHSRTATPRSYGFCGISQQDWHQILKYHDSLLLFAGFYTHCCTYN